MEFIVVGTHHHLIDLQVVVVYKSPSSSFSTFSNIFEKVLVPHVDKFKPLVIIGNFNINVTQPTNKIEEYIYRKLNCRQFFLIFFYLIMYFSELIYLTPLLGMTLSTQYPWKIILTNILDSIEKVLTNYFKRI